MASVDRSAVVWFRDDLRLADQPALRAALDTGRPIVALYVHDEGRSSGRTLGGASRWWLHHSLAALGESLEKIGGRLDIVAGEHADTPRIVAALDAACVFWTRRYGGADVACDAEVKARLVADGVEAHSFNGQLLREPWEVSTKAGTPMRVFTPFWRAHQALGAIARPLPAPRKMKAAPWPKGAPKRSALADLDLLPTRPDWAEGLRETWTPGERGAEARLARFLDDALASYAEDRDRPDKDATSQLSPHLRFGEISPRRVWAAVKHLEESEPAMARPAAKFLSELGWREFSYHLLFHHPDLATRNFAPRFDAFPWREVDTKTLRAWRFGRTGYPLVDAGMRELRRTGYMQNRVRMIAASLLVKHLLVDWRVGEAWFWDNLCDADPANNAAGWQWVAGSGADAAPYFRVFNPILQGEKFDPKGVYVRRWVPELAGLPDAVIHKPWTASEETLRGAGLRIPQDYPAPIIDHAEGRARALRALAALDETAPAGADQ